MGVIESFEICKPKSIEGGDGNKSKGYEHHVSRPAWYGAEVEGKESFEAHVVLDG